MKFKCSIRKLLIRPSFYHFLFVLGVVLLLSFGYAKFTNTAIEPEVLALIKSSRPSDAYMLEKNRMQVLFMQERGWFFIVFASLVLSIMLWMRVSNRRRSIKTVLNYRYNLREKLSIKLKKGLSFQERLHLKYSQLTENDVLIAEMLIDGLSSKDISLELNIAPSSVNTARYRLRKKMLLSPETNLLDVLRQI
ncbi:LuxR C-terminal-related transcriptional regulator [Flavivirga sp. 57AJ16]|uniref:LuxR C-terminal-related transcriptional regulator n=1 Tax=Flavivirga sp. 57AJ16 TaxID=3025307 RepID=UPI002365AD25|nr:LuxR C-terminal-related transcriptional regulator [Flavivirga sp. 57AJ16]MDD7886012.1 LuxR C-terminal-related transcriptional regulator [Flavivirga sp. 57AJ16]